MRTTTVGVGLVAALLAVVLGITAPAGAQGAETCNGLPATITGTSGDDRIEGTAARDVIVAKEGRDIIFGRGGNDVICGGPGNDVIKGGAGKDYMEGNQGNDKIVGGIGADTLIGGSAKDKLFGGGGGDTLVGGPKLDFLNGQNGNDTCDLDHLDRFSACERGDVIGQTGNGPQMFDLEPVPDSFALKHIVLGGQNALQGPDVSQSFVMEVFWVEDPEEFGPSISVFSADDSFVAFHAPDQPQGIIRFTTFKKSDRVEIDGVLYHETVVVHPANLTRLGLDTMGGRPDVFRIDPPTTGPTGYVFDFDSQAGFGGGEIEFFGRVDEFEDFDSTFDTEVNQLTGTTTHGVHVVAVDASDWTLSLTPPG